MVRTALAFADDDDAGLALRLKERLLLLELDKWYPCTILDGLLPPGWASDPCCGSERALVERVNADLVAEHGIVLAVHCDDDGAGPRLMLCRPPAEQAPAWELPGLDDLGRHDSGPADTEAADALRNLAQPHREQIRQIAEQALDRLNHGRTPSLAPVADPPDAGLTPLRNADGVRLDQVAAWRRMIAAAQAYRSAADELRAAAGQGRGAGIDDDVLRAWLTAAIGQDALRTALADDQREGHTDGARPGHDPEGEQERLDDRIAALKARLSELNPVEEGEAYNRLFGDLVALEQRRRGHQ
ncbi:hypothetical protein [Actinomadura opuntiae]|uniref:hypothetical protein n=1 Tax=Actinomadura sp. OS1-43 TaxID=604315 RepID=UPI00255AE555|nr:hypothetical protein [Actinomadura sp. OS1-43]MDL4813134.1 hypothetical protein [Actinomadura sp. OS1-43]